MKRGRCLWHVCLITGKRSDKQKDSGKEVGVVTVGTGEVGGEGWRRGVSRVASEEKREKSYGKSVNNFFLMSQSDEIPGRWREEAMRGVRY